MLVRLLAVHRTFRLGSAMSENVSSLFMFSQRRVALYQYLPKSSRASANSVRVLEVGTRSTASKATLPTHAMRTRWNASLPSWLWLRFRRAAPYRRCAIGWASKTFDALQNATTVYWPRRSWRQLPFVFSRWRNWLWPVSAWLFCSRTSGIGRPYNYRLFAGLLARGM